MTLIQKYTTVEKKAADALKEPEEQSGEKDKTELSNDAYAVCEFIELLINKIEHARITSIK